MNEASTVKKMQPVGDWLKEGFGYISKNWVMIFKTSGWAFLMYYCTIFLVTFLSGIVFFSAGALGVPLNFITGTILVVAGLALGIFAISVAGKMLYFIILAIKDPILKIRETWRSITLKQGLSLYWIMILCLFAGYSGMIFLIVPGIIVFTWVSLSIFIKVDQNIGGLQALMLSRDYVRGYFWPLVGRFIIITLLVLIFPIIYIFTFGFSSDPNSISSVIWLVIYTIVMLIAMSVVYRLVYLLYLNLVSIKGKLELKATTWRTVRWGLLAYSPIVFGLFSLIILMAINPAKQIQKAKEQAAAVELSNKTPEPYIYHEPTALQQQYVLALSAILSVQNNENYTTLGSDLQPTVDLKQLLIEWWGVSDRNSAIETLDWLRDYGHRTEYMYISQFIVDKDVTTCAGLENPLDGCKDEDIKLLHDLGQSINSQLGSKTIAAWDYGRLINVARWSYTLGYINEEEAWTYMVPAAQKAQAEYDTWANFGKSYILGRAYWMRDESANDIQFENFQYLNNPTNKTPWTTLDWQTNLD